MIWRWIKSSFRSWSVTRLGLGRVYFGKTRMMFRRSMRAIIKPRIDCNIADTLFTELSDCTSVYFQQQDEYMSKRPYVYGYPQDIRGSIATDTITTSSTVTIYYNMARTTPTISSTSTMDYRIGLFESRTLRVKIITNTFLAFENISTRSISIRICPLQIYCVSFRNRNVSEGRPAVNLEKSSILILKIPTNPNWAIFVISIIISHHMRLVEIIILFPFHESVK